MFKKICFISLLTQLSVANQILIQHPNANLVQFKTFAVTQQNVIEVSNIFIQKHDAVDSDDIQIVLSKRQEIILKKLDCHKEKQLYHNSRLRILNSTFFELNYSVANYCSQTSLDNFWRTENIKNLLLKKNAGLLEEYETISINLYEKFKFASQIKVNGLIIEPKKMNFLQNEIYQIVVYSNIYYPIILNQKLNEDIMTSTIPIIKGECGQFTLNRLTEFNFSQAKIFLNEACVQSVVSELSYDNPFQNNLLNSQIQTQSAWRKYVAPLLFFTSVLFISENLRNKEIVFE